METEWVARSRCLTRRSDRLKKTSGSKSPTSMHHKLRFARCESQTATLIFKFNPFSLNFPMPVFTKSGTKVSKESMMICTSSLMRSREKCTPRMTRSCSYRISWQPSRRLAQSFVKRSKSSMKESVSLKTILPIASSKMTHLAQAAKRRTTAKMLKSGRKSMRRLNPSSKNMSAQRQVRLKNWKSQLRTLRSAMLSSRCF